MKGYIDNLERLGHPVSLNLGVSLILISLRKEFDSFVQNYNMHSMGKTINELHAMLKLHEKTLPKNNAPALHAIRARKVQKVNKHKKPQPQMAARGQNQRKGKNKPAYAPKPKIPPTPKKEDPAKDSIYRECGIFAIELNTFLNRSWIYDTGCGTHICNTTQGLRASRKLKSGALSLYVGNGQREAVEAIGVFHLCFQSVLEIGLNNCHYAPSITRGVISVSRLYEDDFINCFLNNTIQVSRNNMVYFSAIPRDGIFEIDLSNSYANDSSMYAVSNKRAKTELDSALLWHCRLGNIRLLKNASLVCLIVSRQGASYFITFTDDFSRYGYVYLLKHKHEMFETFKMFQKEVENQLGKTIKSLRSDRGGEYMSQEFLDHLKDHRIIVHRTPPYTPQHNGVSERRNRSQLDMVRSMMSQTTLPKSFWDYALETVARILNMVPTKKVEKTPYEVWHGQAPKMSYLKVWGCEALEASGSLEDLEIIQEEDTHPSINISLHHEEDDLEIDEPQSDIVPIRRSTRTRHAPDRMCLYIDADEHELGYLGEPANYRAAMLDLESDKWLNAMNVEMQSMKDNEVWDLVDLPPNGKTVADNWLFKKKTDMDGVVHTYKAHLVAKGYIQTLGIIDQASRQWNKRFDDEIKKFGFSQNADEPCVYLKASGSNVTFIILYVDDILIMGNIIQMLQDVKSYLGKCFAMKDLDGLHVCLAEVLMVIQVFGRSVDGSSSVMVRRRNTMLMLILCIKKLNVHIFLSSHFPLPPALVALAGQHIALEILAAHIAWVKRSKEIAGLMAHDHGAEDPTKSWKISMLMTCYKELLVKRLFYLLDQSKAFGGGTTSHLEFALGKTVNKLKCYAKLHEQIINLPKSTLLPLMLFELVKSKKVKSTTNATLIRCQGNKSREGMGKKNKPRLCSQAQEESPTNQRGKIQQRDPQLVIECGETGHWKRNCPQYLAELLKKKKNTASGAGGGSGYLRL
ncbi:retrotransposon protein, putative, ty1-copia subclass [Tanacetum coccineum]